MRDDSGLLNGVTEFLPSEIAPDLGEIVDRLFALAGVAARWAARVQSRRKTALHDAVISFPSLKDEALEQLDAAIHVSPEDADFLRARVAEVDGIAPPTLEALHRAQHMRETKPAFVAQLSGALTRMGKLIRAAASRLHRRADADH